MPHLKSKYWLREVRSVPIPYMPQERGGRVESSLLTDSGATNVGKVDREGFARDGYKGPGKTPNGGTSPFWKGRKF